MKIFLLSALSLLTIIANAQINDLTFTSSQTTITAGDSVLITTTGSQIGYNYMLRDNSNDSIIAGPLSGTGSDLVFNTSAITNTTTYNVFATDSYQMSLTSSYDYLDLTSDNRTINDYVTVAAWVKTTNANGVIRNIVIKYGNDAGYILRFRADGKAYFEGRDGTNTFKSSGASATVFGDGQWHYLVGTANLNTGEWKIYVDGTLENSTTNSVGYSMITTSTLYIGHTFSSSLSFVGEIKDVTIWDIELTPSEISSNMTNCLTGGEYNIVGHFFLKEGLGDTIIDNSSLAINGTLNINSASGWTRDTLTCRDSLEMTQTETVTVNPVGVFENNQEVDLMLFPNPTTGKVTFTTTGISTSLDDRIETIEIYNLTGQKVAMFNNTNTIDISQLSNGIYTAKVVTGKGITTKKIIKE